MPTMEDRFVAFIKERYAIYERRKAGAPKPWTKDKILQSYRFCNVYRELDTVTKWINDNWRVPHRHDPNLWFAMCVARLVNWPGTLAEMRYPVAWDRKRFIRTIHKIQAEGRKAYSGAYIVSTNGSKQDKAEYLAQHVLTPLWNARTMMQPRKEDTLEAFYERLRAFNGMGSFLAAQVVADIKYVDPLKAAKDWRTFAASGPGSRRGLNRLFNRPTEEPYKEAEWREDARAVWQRIGPRLERMPLMHMQDLQNCLCEFDKYERTRKGEGLPRSNYPGSK